MTPIRTNLRPVHTVATDELKDHDSCHYTAIDTTHLL